MSETPKNKKEDFVFFGTPDFAVGVLYALEEKGFVPALVITAPDAPAGRGHILTPPPVKVWAQTRGIPVLQPENLKNLVTRYRLPITSYQIVAAYGKIIPKAILDLPKFGTLNVHPSLLPRLRGASPISSAILSEEKTGVTIMLVDEEMDHGDIVAQKELAPEKWQNFANDPPYAKALEKELAKMGGELLAEILPDWIAGKITPLPQDHTKATYCAKIQKEDGLIDPAEDPLKNLRKIRAFAENPGAYFFVKSTHAANKKSKESKENILKNIRVKITEAKLNEKTGALEILRVIPEGKKEMLFSQFHP